MRPPWDDMLHNGHLTGRFVGGLVDFVGGLVDYMPPLGRPMDNPM